MLVRFRQAVAAAAAAALLVLQAAVPVGADEPVPVQEQTADGAQSGITTEAPVEPEPEPAEEPNENLAVLTVDGLPTKLTVNQAYDFTVRTKKGSAPDGTKVRATFTVQREGITENHIETCYYLEDGDEQGTCVNLPLSSNDDDDVLEGSFGPKDGFPLVDEATRFRVVFRAEGEYAVEIRLVGTDDGTVYATFKEKYEAEFVDVSVATNLPDRTLQGQQREFTVRVDPGSHVGTTVKGAIHISDLGGASAEDFVLAYKGPEDEKYTDLAFEDSEGNSDRLQANFGDDQGYTLDQVTTWYFRLTPRKTGTYRITIKFVGDGQEWPDECTLQVVDKKPTVSFNLPSRLDEEERKTFDVKLTPGDFKDVDVSLRFTIERSRIDEDDVDLWYQDDDDGYERLSLTDKGSKLEAIYDTDDLQLDDERIRFRIRFDQTGNYDVTVDLIWDTTGEVLASDTDKVKVEDPDDEEEDDEDEEDQDDRDDEKPADEKPGTPKTPAPPTPAPTQPDLGKGTPDDPAVIRDNNTHGSTTAVVTDGAARVTHQVSSAPTAGSLAIDLMESTVPVQGNPVPVGERTVAIPASVISQLGSDQHVIIRTPVAELRIPPAVLQAMIAGHSGDTVRLSLKAVDGHASIARARASGLSLAGQIVSLSAEVASGSQAAPVASFSSPVALRLPFTTFQVPLHLGVYRLNPATGEWQYVGGRVNSAGRYVEVQLPSLSEYAVFEYTQNFLDVAQDHWAQADIQLMASRHIVKGKYPGFFEPEAQVTRAEFTALLVRALNLKSGGLFLPVQSVFADVPLSHWSYTEVQAALEHGLVAPAANFRPDDPITRQEMAVMLTRALALRDVPQVGAPTEVVLARYSDRGQIAAWAQDAVSQTTQLGIMTGYPWGTFEPEKTATRAEAVTVLKRLMTVTGDLML